MNRKLNDFQRRQIEEMRRKSWQGVEKSGGIHYENEGEHLRGGSSFSIRLMISLLLLAGFLQLHLSGASYRELNTDKAIEAVSRNVEF